MSDPLDALLQITQQQDPRGGKLLNPGSTQQPQQQLFQPQAGQPRRAVDPALRQDRSRPTTPGSVRDSSALVQFAEDVFTFNIIDATQNFSKGVVNGALKNDLIRFAATTGALSPVDEQDIDRFLQKMEADPEFQDSSLADVGKFVGKYGPDFYGATKLFRLFSQAAVKGLQLAAPKIAAKAQASKMVGAKSLERQAIRLQARAGDRAGALLPTTMPGLERAAITVGGATGVGLFEAARSTAAGEDMGTVGSSALQGAALTAALDGALMGAGRLLTPLAKKVNLQEALDHFLKSGALGQSAQEVGGLRSKAREAVNVLAKQRLAVEQQRQIVDQLEQIPSHIPRRQVGSARPPSLKAQQKKLAEEFRKEEKLQAEFFRAANELGAFFRFQGSRPLRPGRTKGPIFARITDEVPFNPNGHNRNIQAWMLNWTKNIEDFAGRLGITGTKIVEQLSRAEAESFLAVARIDAHLKRLHIQAAKEMGLKRVPNDGKFLIPALKVAEEEGIDAVQDQFGVGVANVFREFEGLMKDRFGQLAKMGAEPFIRPEEFGTRFFFPHVMRMLPEEEIKPRMTKAFLKQFKSRGMDEAAAKVAADNAVARAFKLRKGLTKFGSIDHQRQMPGSTAKLLADDVPFEDDPFVAIGRYAGAVERRIAFGKRFGIDGELIDPMKRVATAEGASESLLNQITDVFFENNPADEFARRMAQNVTNVQIAMKLPFAAFPNAGQSSNSIIWSNFTNFMEGVSRAAHAANRADIDHQVGLVEGLFQSLRKTAMGGTDRANWTDRLVDRELKAVLFTPTERVNRLLGGASTGALVHNTLAKALGGNLRGVHLDAARRQFAKMDLDLDDLVRRIQKGGKMTAEEFDIAVFKGAQQSQFTPDLLRRPIKWNTPHGKVLSQFNTFVLGQWNFLRNHVLAEAAQGNHGPLATALAMYPVGGELVAQGLEFAKDRGRPRNDVARMLDNYSLQGGLGIVSSFYQAAHAQRLGMQILGPTASDSIRFFTDSVSQGIDPFGAAAKFVVRQPVTRAVARLFEAGDAGLEELGDLAEALTPRSSPSPDVMSRGALIPQRPRSRRPL